MSEIGIAITDLPAATALTGDEIVPIIQDGDNVRTTAAALAGEAGNGIPTVINVVTDYGAAGDGVTNDRTAIANALSAADGAGGGVVYLPEGTYIVGVSGTTGAMLTIPSEVTLRGAGPKASIIQSGSTVNGHSAVAFATSSSFGRIESVGITATSTTTGGQAIIGVTTTDCAVVDVWIAAKYAWGVFAGTNSSGLQILRCVIDGASNDIEINGSSYCTIQGCHLSGATNNAIELYDAVATRATGNQAIDNYIVSPAGSGIGCFGTVGNIISGNRIVSAGTHGIFLEVSEVTGTQYSTDNIVAGNYVTAATSTGITLTTGAKRNTITGNTVTSTAAAGPGIFVDGLSNTLDSNTCSLNGGHGIAINTSAHRTVAVGNVCTDNSGTGVGSRDGLNVGADYCKIIGNVCSDTRGASNRQQIGVSAAGTSNVLIGNGGTGNTYSATYDGGTTTYKRGNEGTATDSVASVVPIDVTALAEGSDMITNSNAALEDNEYGTFRFNSTAAAQVPLAVRAHASQSASLQRWQNSSGATLAAISAGGKLGTGGDYVGAGSETVSIVAPDAGVSLAFYTAALATTLTVFPTGMVNIHGSTARINFNNAAHSQTTVGAAGGASALPATPTKYLKIQIEGSEYVIPCYAVS